MRNESLPMHADESAPAKNWVALFIAVCLVGLNMRMTIAGLGPLLEDISADQGVSPSVLGLLAAIPLVTWALVSPLAQGVANLLGLDRAVTWSLLVLFVATVWRSLPGSPLNLWLGTALIGVALAIANVLLPAAIKRDFGKRVPLVLGVYSALIGLSSTVGAFIVAPIAQFELGDSETAGWRWALLATGASIPVTIFVWMWATRRPARKKISGAAENAEGAEGAEHPSTSDHTVTTTAVSPPPDSGTPEISVTGENASDAVARDATDATATRRVWRDPVAWQIAIYMGAQSWPFYVYANWLAPIMMSRGTDVITAGNQVTLFHIGGILGSLIAPLISRGSMRRLFPLIVPIMHMLGASGVVFAPQLIYLWLAVCGIASGASLSVALTFIAQRSPSIAVAGAVSGMSQSLGYLIAAIGPVLFGWFFDLTGAWVLPLVSLLAATVLQFAAALWLLRERMVFSKY